MTGTEQAVFTVLVMVSDGRGSVLVEDRTDPGKRPVCGFFL
ncbi:MAG: hypothetical protein ACI3V5_04235 [Faecousia sp.]